MPAITPVVCAVHRTPDRRHSGVAGICHSEYTSPDAHTDMQDSAHITANPAARLGRPHKIKQPLSQPVAMSRLPGPCASALYPIVTPFHPCHAQHMVAGPAPAMRSWPCRQARQPQKVSASRRHLERPLGSAAASSLRCCKSSRPGWWAPLPCTPRPRSGHAARPQPTQQSCLPAARGAGRRARKPAQRCRRLSATSIAVNQHFSSSIPLPSLELGTYM